jgi:hypothetical protein
MDIDPATGTLAALKRIDFNKYSFSVITYEHDLYDAGPEPRAESREILASFGYTLALSDVRHGDLQFEDWYVNESFMMSDNWKMFRGENIPMDTANVSSSVEDLFSQILDVV